MAKVSVVVPVYNAEPWLRTALDSLKRQTLEDMEFICVNDGSTDASGEILREYVEEDSRFKLINQENGGYGKAMNAGMARAEGEYTGILEPDDYAALTMYEDLYNKAKENDLDMIRADFCRFTTDREKEAVTLKHIHLSPEKDDYGKVFKPTEKTECFFYVMNTWAGIYRTSFLREHGIRHNETPGAAFQDNGFRFQTLLHAERAMILDKAYYRVRRDNPNSSVNNPGMVYAMNREYDYIRGILEKDPAVWEKMKGIYWRQRIRNCAATLWRIDPGFRKEYMETVRGEMRSGLMAGEFWLKDLPANERGMAQHLLKKEYFPKPEELSEAEALKRSAAYRVGTALTAIPRKIRDAVRGAAGGGGK